MNSMRGTLFWLVLALPLASPAPCPFALNRGTENLPDDEIHRPSLRRRLTDDPETKKILDAIIQNRTNQRSLNDMSSKTPPTDPNESDSPTPAQSPDSPTVTHRPTTSPKLTTTPSICVSEETYDAIDTDIVALITAFGNDDLSRAHFLGGIVRLAAHDFMDFDVNNPAVLMGADGCIDMEHPANSGLPQDVWCDDGCALTQVYNNNFSHMSKADFWVAASNAVIRIASNNQLDLKSTFVSGRVDAESCVDSATRLPLDTSCTEVEGVFLDRLGLTWTDAVALLGAHTIGRGDEEFSGHHGIWVDTERESTLFDKRYYEEIFRRAWIPRNQNSNIQDWTWGGKNGDSPRFMLNTDMCLFFDVDVTFPCCTDTSGNGNGGTHQCDRGSEVLRNTPCATYAVGSPREEAANAVELFAGVRAGGGFNDDNAPFFRAFASAWDKANTNGWTGLQPLAESCASPSVRPTGAPTSPMTSPTKSPTGFPVSPQPSVSPTHPVPTPNPTPNPTNSPSISSSCEDEESVRHNRKTKDCAWVKAKGKCKRFASNCPLSCGTCDTGRNIFVNLSSSTPLPPGMAVVCKEASESCGAGEECCSGECLGHRGCAGRGQQLLKIAQGVRSACAESRLDEALLECQSLCHAHLCCFERGKYSCVEDEGMNCPAYVGCEMLVGFAPGAVERDDEKS